jgi:hypothetical protein
MTATRKKLAPQESDLIRELQQLYSEPDMRTARRWWRNEFWPESAADYLKFEAALGTPQNTWLVLIINYWSMASSLVVNGTLSRKALLDSAFVEEMFHVFSKVHPFLKDLRNKTHKPALLRNVEILINGSKAARQRLAVALRQPSACHKDPPQRLAAAC